MIHFCSTGNERRAGTNKREEACDEDGFATMLAVEFMRLREVLLAE